MKKLLICMLLFVLLSPVITPLAATEVTAAPARIGTSAEAASVIDVQSGRLIYSQQGDKRMRIASLTKIMTAIVAIEQGQLSDLVTVSKRAFGKEGSSIYLKLGEEMSLHNLLYGLMLRSGNDAATAIAEHVGGSEEGFVLLMNEKARELGMEGSSFMNPHGLDHERHYSTANDMAKLTAYALRNKTFQEIVKTEVKRVPEPGEAWDRVWYNKNKMLNLYDGANGVKTGYTKLAKRCLVSSASHNGQQLAVVTLNDPNDWLDHGRLLDWGFKHYKLTALVDAKEQVEPGLMAGRTFYYALSEGEEALVTRKVELTAPETAAYRLGDAGKLILSLNGKEIGSVPLVQAAEGNPKDRETLQQGNSGDLTRSRDSWTERLVSLVRVLFKGEG